MPDFCPTGGVYVGVERGGTTYGKIEYIGTTDLWKTTRIHIFPQHKNYINPYTFFVFEIRKLYPFIYYSVLYYKGPSWSWSNLVGLTNTYYICNQCLSPLTVWVRAPFMWGVFDTTLCDKVCQWRDRSVFSPASSTQITDRQDLQCSSNIVESGVKHHNPTHHPLF
jgi:hypothetical protein